MVLSTFHSFCVRVLRVEIERLGYRRNFTISSESDARTLVRRSLEDLDGVRERFDAGMFLGHISALKSAGTAPKKPAPPGKHNEPSATQQKYDQWLPEIYDRYQSALRAANTVDFDDLLLLTLRLWREHPEILARYQARFRYVMVDEYQDTNRVQYDLLHALTSEHRNLCVVGDDDQSIYSWRGADISNILAFEKVFTEAKIVKLEQNYRSTVTILDAANRVIANNTARREKNLWSALGQGRPLDRFVVADEEQEAKQAVSWLEHIRERTGANPGDFAVLYRSNQQSRPFEIAFRQAGIPYTVIGGQEFFERAEVKDILAYLRALVNPRDEPALLRIVNVPRRGIGDATLHRAHDLCRANRWPLTKGLAEMLKEDKVPANTKAGIRQFFGLLSRFREAFQNRTRSVGTLVPEFVDALDYRGDLLRTSKSSAQFQNRWNNLEALFNAVADYDEATPAGSLSGFLDQSALVRDEDRRGTQRTPDNAVRLMTIHSAKGLEFPFVFIVGLEDGLLPHDKSVKDGGIEEERRLFYVALTRGKRHVTLFEAIERDRRGKRRPSKTSRFAAEIPDELVRVRVRAAREGMAAEAEEPPAKKPARRKRRRAGS